MVTTWPADSTGAKVSVAEGLEQPRQTREKHGPEGKGEAKPEAVFSDGVAKVPALAAWLGDHLDDAQLAELVRELAIVNNGHRSA